MSKYLLCYITLWNVNKQFNCVQIPGAACTAPAGPFNMLQAGHWKVGDSSVTFLSWPSETSALIPNIHKLKPVHILLLLQKHSTDTLIYNVNTKRRKIKGNERIKRENKHMRPAYGWYSMSWSCLLNWFFPFSTLSNRNIWDFLSSLYIYAFAHTCTCAHSHTDNFNPQIQYKVT